MQQRLLLQIAQKLARGNSATASKLATARNIALSGAVKGNAKFDGSGNVTIATTQANIAILTGTIKANSGSSYVDYPTGFNRTNCAILSSMFNNTLNNNYGTGSTFDSSSYVTGNFVSATTLAENNIVIKAKLIHLSSEQYPVVDNISRNINYKIILMKL